MPSISLKLPGCLNDYEELRKSNMYEWFIEIGEIKAMLRHA
jgi:hypothetical protein